MKYEVDGWNNFCRVFELPESYPSDYCFGGGHPVNFQMVDWFEPVPDIGRAAVTKEVWRERAGEITTKEVDLAELDEYLSPWLKDKPYMKKGRQYLVICDFGATLIITP